MAAETESASDVLPSNCVQIEVHVAELNQLFNSMDPSPFHDRDLDPNAEAFIMSWAREVHGDPPLCLVVYLDQPTEPAREPSLVRDAIQQFFQRRAQASRSQVRQLFRVGRTSLMIGLASLVVSIVVGKIVGDTLGAGAGDIAREFFVIGGWVAMWRPLQIFLYDWWPISAEARLFDRLSAMAVRFVNTREGARARPGKEADVPGIRVK